MYKPGTKLIMNQLWAAAAAHELGFDVFVNNTMSINGKEALNSLFTEWRITVTESGPNAAKRFLPQVDDVLRGFSMPDKYAVMISKDFMSEWLRKFSAVKIIERNGIPFPQFSEVIEP